MINFENFTDLFENETENSQPISLSSRSSSAIDLEHQDLISFGNISNTVLPLKGTGEREGFRSIEEIDPKYRGVFSYQYFNFVQTKVIEDALYSDKSLVVCAPTGSGKTVIFEMAIVQLLMEMDNKNYNEDFKIIYMAPIKALCTERLTEWYPKFTQLNCLCIEVTGDTDVDFSQLKPYRIIITTPEKWDMLTRRWRDNRAMVEVIKLFLIDEVHILNDVSRGPVLEAVVSRMKTIQSSVQSAYRIEQLQKQKPGNINSSIIEATAPKIRFVAVSATISNPEDVAEWLGTSSKPAVFYKFGDECRPVKLKRIVEGYPCPEGTSIFKFDIILNYKLWPIIQRYHDEKPTLIFCNTRKSVILTAETLSREITINFSPDQKAKLSAVACTIKNKKIQSLILCGIGCHHAGLLFEERINIERAFRNSDLPILITTTTLAMGVNLPAHLVIVKNTQQYVNGAYQEYSMSTVLQMVGRAGRPQFDTEATAVIMTRLADKGRYQALVGGCEPLQSYLHKRLAENLNSEAALGTVTDLAQCVQWVRSTFLFVRAARDPRKYLGLPQSAPVHLISKKIEELCVKAMNGLASSGLITMDELSCIESTEAGRLLSVYYLDLETMKNIMKIKGNESLEQLLWIVCDSHELSDMHLRVDERRCLNALNRNSTATTIRFPMKGKINTRQMKLYCIIQAVLGCLPIHEPSLNQEAIKIMRIADRICKCLVSYITRSNLLGECPQNYQTVLNSIVLAKCIESHLWENSIYVSKQLKGIGPTFSSLLATAGKLNFMLLEESHPRDLERIMNKGPPAGNVLRKQISLLPKYQLTMIPIDENSVKVHLVLLNRMYLAENMEQLTAGVNHKSYIIIGDTENYLLLLTTFKDKDLVSVYDGQITYDILRRHNFEHKIIAHCVSSNFAGIDVQCEYLFQDIDTFYTNITKTISSRENPKIKHTKQPAITDSFKIRKRKNCETDASPCEKKKREFAFIGKMKSLKQSFGKSSKVITEDKNKETSTFNNVKNSNLKTDFTEGDITQKNKQTNLNIDDLQSFEEIDEDDEHVSIILNEIEKEISKHDLNDYKSNTNILPKKGNKMIATKKTHTAKDKKINESSLFNEKIENSNLNAIDKIEMKADITDPEDVVITTNNTFVSAVKSHIDAYMERTKQITSLEEKTITHLLEFNQPEKLTENKTDINKTTSIKNIDISTFNDIIVDSKVKNHFTEKATNNILNNNERNNSVANYENDLKNKNEIQETLDQFRTNNISVTTNTNETFPNCVKPNYHFKSLLDFELNSMKKSLPFDNCYNIQSNNTHSVIPLSIVSNKSKFTSSSTKNIIQEQKLSPNSTEYKGNIHEMLLSTQVYVKDISGLKNEKNNCTAYDPKCYNFDEGPKTYPPDSTKKFSITKTHLNIYSKDDPTSNYCVISKLKIDLDIIKTQCVIENDNLVLPEHGLSDILIENKLKEDQNIIESDFGALVPNEQCDTNKTQNSMKENSKTIRHQHSNDSQTEIKTKKDFEATQNDQNGYSSVSEQYRTVKDVIYKYKNIASSEICTPVPKDRQTLNSATINKNTKVNQRDKIKRPFKITDLTNIQESNIQIPNDQSISQIINRKFVEKQVGSIKGINNTEINKFERNLNEFIQIPEVRYSQNDIFELESPQQQSPVDSIGSRSEETELNNDLDLSQSMFNPKALLECLVEDVIIPPPLQFCDDDVSLNQSSGFDNVESLDLYVNKEHENTFNFNNFFDEKEYTSLTPTKEVKKWPQSREDEANVCKSFNVECSDNVTTTEYIPQNILRKLKLNRFKFSRKNVIKIKK